MLSRLVFVFCIVYEVSSFFLVDRHNVKPIDCTTTEITSNGSYLFVPINPENPELCSFTLVVPEKHTATLKIRNDTCKSISGTPSNMGVLCDQKELETHFFSDVYKFTFASTSLISIDIEFNEITEAECGDYVKNIHDWLGKTIRLTVDQKSQCSLELPPDVEVQFLDFRPKDKIRCCADFYILSTGSENEPLAISTKHSVCEIRNNNLKIRSKCDRTHLFTRGTRMGDEVYLRVRGLPRSSFSECLGDEESAIPPPSCKKKKREQKLL